MAVSKKRENKKIPRYAQEEINDYQNKETQQVIKEFIKIQDLDFQLTEKQKTLIKLLNNKKIVTITGPPGTSKTFVACYAATQALLAGKYSRIILSKPTEVLSGTKDVGALPGSLEEKMAVYMESFTDSFEEFLTPKDFKHLWTTKTIEFKPAQFLRGRSIKDAFIIIDEFQNFDSRALKSIVTRLGRNSTIVFMGDTRQNDIKSKHVAVNVFNELIESIGGPCATFTFKREDIVRESILIKIIDKWEEFEDKGKWPETIKDSSRG